MVQNFTCGVLAADAASKATLCDGDQHPPSPDDSRFLKKIVAAKEETPRQGFAVHFTQRDKLPPDAVEYVDCPLIYVITGIASGTHSNGFVVLEIPKLQLTTGATMQPDLDLIGKPPSAQGGPWGSKL